MIFYSSDVLLKFAENHSEKTLGYMNYIRILDMYKILRDICLSTKHGNRDTQTLSTFVKELELIITTNTTIKEDRIKYD